MLDNILEIIDEIRQIQPKQKTYLLAMQQKCNPVQSRKVQHETSTPHPPFHHQVAVQQFSCINPGTLTL